jgi:hypothetical protein
MANISGYINLGQVVDSLINEQDISRKQRERLLQVSIEGFSELITYHMNFFKEAWLPVSATLGAVDFPSDYVDFISIGINDGGQFRSYTKDDNIIIPEGVISGQDDLDTDKGENTYNSRNDIASYTSRGGINTHYYKIDQKNKRIIINGTSTLTTALLHYVSSGVNSSSSTEVPLYAVRALKDYINWRTAKGADRDRKFIGYQLSARDLRDHEGSFTKDQYLDMIYKTYTRGVKR